MGEIRALVERASEAHTEALLAVNEKGEDPTRSPRALKYEADLAEIPAFDTERI